MEGTIPVPVSFSICFPLLWYFPCRPPGFVFELLSLELGLAAGLGAAMSFWLLEP